MRCQKCSAENPPGAKFCIQCAAPLPRRCPQCAFDNPPEARFCAQCATALVEQPRVPLEALIPAGSTFEPHDRNKTGERRYLTVLFCDLVESTRIATHLDPEEWREIIAKYHRAAAEAVARFGGYVAQYLGDGVMAYFGYPEAQGNDAERAARAGLAILEVISQLDEQPAHTKLTARVGVHSGTVVVGAGAGNRNDLFGDVPSIAARVQAAAEPGSLLITADTQRLVSGWFDVEERGAQVLKGIERPLHLYRVLQPSGARGRLGTERSLTPFIGRADELRVLLSRWNQVRQGNGQVVIIVGEPGIGKSRLIQQFREQIGGEHHLWLESAGDQFAHSTPFYAAAQILREGIGLRGDEDAEGLIKKLHVSLETAGIKAKETLPLIAPLLNVLPPANYPAPPAASEERRRRLLASLSHWAIGLATNQPIAIVLEDLQWADASTVELAKLLVERGASAPLMLIYTARTGFVVPWPIRPHHTQLMLDRLSEIQTREMVAGVAKEKGLSPETIEAVAQRASGVPLFVEELTRDVLEHRDYAIIDQIPATLNDSLMARLDRLGRAHELAQIGAAIGREFSHQLLRIVASVSEDDLEATLEQLTKADLLYVRKPESDKHYIFKHALVRDAAYSTLLKSRRRELHHKIAYILEERFPKIVASAPELLAHHFTEANLAAQAIQYWRRAGKRAIEQSANLEAIVHLRKAIELLKTLPSTSDRLIEEIKLQMTLATPLITTKGYTSPEVERACNRALELCQQVGEVPELFTVLGGLNSIYFNRGELEVALELAKQMLRLAKTQQDAVLLLWAHYAMGLTLASQGALNLSRDHLVRSIALYDQRRGGTYRFVQDPGPTALARLSHVLHSLGYPEQASGKMREAVAQARNLAHPFTLAWVLGSAGGLYWRRGDKSQARELWEERAVLSNQHGFKSLLASASLFLGFALVEQGKAEEGIAKMYNDLSVDALPMGQRMLGLGLLGLALGEAGQIDRGLEKIDEAFTLASPPRKSGDYYLLHLFKGQLILIKNVVGLRKAKQCFSSAMEIAREQNAKSDELRAAIPLAKLLAQQDRREQARAMLSKIYNWFTEGFNTADLKEAKALLEQLQS
ncbi:MAG: AAA family ATPase [Deltaproteobacteria bacterium]|nr:AAA family ATPase [Deltaproteobacteria bacterium]